MARSDYQELMERHTGQWDVLPNGLVVPSLPHGTEWRPGHCVGIALLTREVLVGNRWPAVSGALLAELARRCAVLGALTILPADRRPRPIDIGVRFRRAIPVADPHRQPAVADGNSVLYWRAAAADSGDGVLSVAVRMTRQPPGGNDASDTIETEARFAADPCPGSNTGASVERRMSDYLLQLPRRLALPAYLPGWTGDEIRGICRERPGSLIAAAEQALADAGKIIRGDGVPANEEESMLLADLRYRWIEDVDDICAEYTARPGPRRRDAKGRDWVEAVAELSAAGRPVGEATGNLVFNRRPAV